MAALAAGLSASPAATFDPPVMGWSSWNTYRVNINDNLIRRQADALVSGGFRQAGYRYVNIDDGFFGWRDATGLMHTHPQRFPDGLKGIADYIHSLGLRAGIYSDAGSNTCGSIWDHDKNGVGAGLYGHEEQDARLYFNDWGFDFIKIDYCGAGQELDLEEQRRYTEICQTIRRVATRPVAINICRWAFPGTWAAGIASSWRISPDIRPRWSSVKDIIERNLYLSAYARGGHYNDMDMLEIGRGMRPTEEETHFGMWCMMSSPLLIGCDLTTIPEASRALLLNAELIAVNQDTLGLQARVVQHRDGTYVLAKDILQLRGLTRAVALYNPTDSAVRIRIALSDIELSGKARLRDLLHHKDLKPVRDSISMTVAPHGSVFLKVTGRERIEPQLYEAEWAWLPQFNALGKQKKLVTCMAEPKASGGETVRFVGGSRENYAEWDQVFSAEGGPYELVISYMPHADRKLEVDVNGSRTLLTALETRETDVPAQITVPVTLRKGYNVIRMGSAYCWAPDIDCFRLVRGHLSVPAASAPPIRP